jgi:hypothetical protein
MNSYSKDLDRIRDIVDFKGQERLDYFKALCQMQTLAMDLANQKFELTMKVAMLQAEVDNKTDSREGWKELYIGKPSWTARNSEEWGEVDA